MRVMAIFISLLCLVGCKPMYWVMGDSITSPADSWANQINAWRWEHPNWGFPYMQVNAMPGATLTNFDFPDHIHQWPYGPKWGVVIALGTNDAGQGIPVATVEAKLAAMIAQAGEQGFSEVTCVLPYIVDQWNVDVRPYREAFRRQCHQVIDITLDHQDSPDGLHLGPLGQQTMARDFLTQLGEAEQ